MTNDQRNSSSADPQSAGSLHFEASQLTAVMVRTIGESLHLRADSIEFTHAGDRVDVILRAGEDLLKQTQMKPIWFERLEEWLVQRRSVFTELQHGDETSCESSSFRSAVRIGEQLVDFEVVPENGNAVVNRLSIQDLRVMPISLGLDKLGVTTAQAPALRRILSEGYGVVGVAEPTAEDSNASFGSILAILGGTYVGDANQLDDSVAGDIRARSHNYSTVLRLKESNVVDAVRLMFSHGLVGERGRFGAVISQRFVPRVCQRCARRVRDEEALDRLTVLGEKAASIRQIFEGEGCEHCGQTGCSGLVGLVSVLVVNSDVSDLLQSCSDDCERLSRGLYALGVRSIVEDGLTKLRQGLISWESLKGVYDELSESDPLLGIMKKRSTACKSGDPEGGIAEDPEPHEKQRDRDRSTILVVEDDPDQRSILDLMCRTAGYEVLLAEDGVEALKVLSANLPDLILTDLMMPRMDGATLVGRIKADERLNQIPIVILTVVADEEREFTLLDLGADDYCEKTIQRKLLLKRISKLIQR